MLDCGSEGHLNISEWAVAYGLSQIGGYLTTPTTHSNLKACLILPNNLSTVQYAVDARLHFFRICGPVGDEPKYSWRRIRHQFRYLEIINEPVSIIRYFEPLS